MSVAAWTLVVLTVISLDGLAIGYLIRGRAPVTEQRAWFDHEQFVNVALLDRVRSYSTPLTIAYPCSYGGDLLEYPIAAGWDEDAILHTLAEIGAL